MKITTFPTAGAAAILLFASPAHADFGHVADIAGHSHWIGLAAASAAAVIAIGISVLGKKRDARKVAETSDAPDADAASDDTPAKA
jgi:Family of unknown function (DUF6732)